MRISSVRFLLLIAALVLAVCGLFTSFMAPSWMEWHVRGGITIVEGEYGYLIGLVLLPVGISAWLLRRGHAVTATCTLALCFVASLLMLKPLVEARHLGRTLPGLLERSFGPTVDLQPPFSLSALFAEHPEAVPIEELHYQGFLMLDFYRAIGTSSAPCVISLHGGGFSTGGHRSRRPLNYWLARHGYAVATPDYRGFPQARWPAQRRDVLDTIEFLRMHAAQLGIDPQRIVLLGFSAGGMLAEATAYSVHDAGIRGVIGCYGPTDLRAAWYADSNDIVNGVSQRAYLESILGGTPKTAAAAYDSLSGSVVAGPGCPPTLLIHGHLDSLVPESQSELLAEKLRAAGVPSTLVSVPWATHGFNLVNFESPGAQISTYAIGQFLAAVTR